MKIMYLKTTETKTDTANKETVSKKLECKKKWDTTMSLLLVSWE